MSERVRVGVIGTSWWADLCHLPALASHPRAEIAAICGRNRQRADEMAAKYHIPSVFTEYRDMIEHAGLHSVVVNTPDDLHYPMTMAALDAGLHVLCEKPLALSVEQAKAMYEKAEATGVKHMTFYTYRWMPFYRHLKQLVADGYLGRLFHAHFRYLAGYGVQAPYRWRSDRERSAGVLGDFGSHMIDMARWLAGDIRRVSALLGVYGDRPRPDGQPYEQANDHAILAVEFDSGAQGVIQLSAVAHTADRRQEQHVLLHGQDGALELELNWVRGEVRGVHTGEQSFQALPVPAELWGDVNRAASLPAQVMETFTKLPVGDRLFIDAILENRPAIPSFYDGLKTQEVIAAALRSHETGRWEQV